MSSISVQETGTLLLYVEFFICDSETLSGNVKNYAIVIWPAIVLKLLQDTIIYDLYVSYIGDHNQSSSLSVDFIVPLELFQNVTQLLIH